VRLIHVDEAGVSLRQLFMRATRFRTSRTLRCRPFGAFTRAVIIRWIFSHA
jgi:hypothetical protein